jgi:hypothetical protein
MRRDKPKAHRRLSQQQTRLLQFPQPQRA